MVRSFGNLSLTAVVALVGFLVANALALNSFADPQKKTGTGGGAWNFEYARHINTPDVARLLGFIAHTSLSIDGTCDSNFVQNFIFRLAVPGDSNLQKIWQNFDKREFTEEQVKCVDGSLPVVKNTATPERVGVSE